jgi:hypothetical protein
MGTITCTVNANRTLTIASISGQSQSTTWARFHQPFFQVSGGGAFDLALTVPDANFRFDPSDPIDFGASGQPSWITILEQESTALTLRISSATTGASQFTVNNTTQGGEPITILVQSLGGSGGAGGTIAVYVGDAQTALIGPLPVGAMAGGSNVHFGFQDQGINDLFLLPAPAVVIEAVDWQPQGIPGYIDLDETSLQLTFSIDNLNSSGPRLEAAFTLDTNFGDIDPTIVTNPDENGP